MNHIYDLVAPYLGVANAAVLFLALIFLLRDAEVRQYAVIVAYIAWELLATAGLTLADVVYHGSEKMGAGTQTAANRLYARLYWTNDVLVDLFRFVLVIILIYKTTEGTNRVSGRLLAGLVLLVMVLPFVVFHPTFQPVPKGDWFTSTSEMLNFGAAIMNLFLWAALIASRKRDPKLLTVSAGLGVVVTGTAIALGVQHLVSQTRLGSIGYLLMNLTQLAGWAIWCWAFRPVAERHPQLGRAISSP